MNHNIVVYILRIKKKQQLLVYDFVHISDE